MTDSLPARHLPNPVPGHSSRWNAADSLFDGKSVVDLPPSNPVNPSPNHRWDAEGGRGWQDATWREHHDGRREGPHPLHSSRYGGVSGAAAAHPRDTPVSRWSGLHGEHRPHHSTQWGRPEAEEDLCDQLGDYDLELDGDDQGVDVSQSVFPPPACLGPVRVVAGPETETVCPLTYFSGLADACTSCLGA